MNAPHLTDVSTYDHEALPQKDTVYTATGGLPANLFNGLHYPVEAHCKTCGQIIRCEQIFDSFSHTGRKPGDPRD